MLKTRGNEIALSLAASAVLALGASAMTLVQDGAPVSTIVTGNDPLPTQRLAAEELQYHLRKMTGATVPIVAEKDLADANRTLILVGQSDLLKERGIDTSKLERETFIVRTMENALVLAGEDGSDVDPRKAKLNSLQIRTGTLFAVYDFLQDQLGVRWVWPGETGEVIPKRATVTVGALNTQETPRVLQRYFRQGARDTIRNAGTLNFPRYVKAEKDRLDKMLRDENVWLRRMKMGASRKVSYGHAFTQDYEVRRTTMPEIYAMQPDGHRGLPNEAYPPEMVKICVTEPKLLDMVVEDFKRLHAADPDFHNMNACENDGGTGYCVCPRCLEWDRLPEGLTHEFPPMGIDGNDLDWPSLVSPRGRDNDSLSNRYFRFYNMVARRLKEIDPEARVVCYAYSRFRYVPVGMEVEPNMFMGIMLFSFYPRTEEMRQIHMDNLVGWKKTGVKMFFRPNSFYYNQALGVPWSAAHQMGDDLSFVLSQGIDCTDFDTLSGHWATEAPSYYVLARMHWDTEATAEQLLSEWCEAFGPAGKHVREYFDHWEKVFERAYTRPDAQEIQDRTGNGTPWGWFRAVGELIDEKDFADAKAILDRARATAAGDAELLQRIHILDLGLDHGRLVVQAMRHSIDHLSFDKDTTYEALWPLVQEVFRVREEVAGLGAFNDLWLNWFELLQHDLHATRVWHDFYSRPWQPMMTPAQNKWSFVPDPKDVGEAEGWPDHSIAGENILRWGPFFHIFYADWDRCRPTTVWKRQSGEKEVINGWYQVTFSVPKTLAVPEAALYIPYISGENAKVWVNGKLLRDVGRDEIAAETPVVVPLADAGITPDREFLLTIKVSSPRSGGLIGPAYIAKPSE